MESYQAQIASNKNVELIHISLDSEQDAAATWAQKTKMTWPTILLPDHAKEALTTPYFEHDPEVPSYILVDASGNIIVRDKTHAFAKIKLLK